MKSLIDLVRRGVEAIMALTLFAMVVLTFADVVGRRIMGQPIYGAHDITEHLMALAVFTGLPLVTAAGLHLTIDLFDHVLDRPALRWWRVMTGLSVAAILGLLAWLFFRHALTAGTIAEVSQALRVPRAPLYHYIAASCALSALAAVLTTFAGNLPADADITGETT